MRNTNFGKTEVLAVEYHMSTPSTEEYKDVNGASSIIDVTPEATNNYLTPLQASITKEAIGLYKVSFYLFTCTGLYSIIAIQ